MRKVILFAIILIVLVIAGYISIWQSGYFRQGEAFGQSAGVGAVDGEMKILSPEEQKTMSDTMQKVVVESAPALGPTYTNNTYRFSVQMPAEFKAQELPNDEGEGRTIVVQNSKGDGVQIYITKDTSGNKSLTADDVRAALPDMRVVDAQDVELGAEKGVAFMSDNEAFGGASREVWFYFGGNLYQISTYARLDPLLKAMFGTWKFF